MVNQVEALYTTNKRAYLKVHDLLRDSMAKRFDTFRKDSAAITFEI